MRKYFSYVNWEIVFGDNFSISDQDRAMLRESDGIEAYPMGKIGLLNEDTYMVETPWGMNMFPSIVVKSKNEPDLSAVDIMCNPQLQQEIELQHRKESMFENSNFCTLAYIDMDASCGFAMVSAENTPGIFKLRSDIYEIPAQLKEIVDDKLRPRFWQYWHSGVLSIDSHAKVYRMNIERIEHYVEELFPSKYDPTIIDRKSAQTYVDMVTSHEYKSREDDNKMVQLRKKYEKQCLLLMDSLDLHVLPLSTNICVSPDSAREGKRYEKVQEMKRQGLSIGQIAKKLGLSYSAVSKLW